MKLFTSSKTAVDNLQQPTEFACLPTNCFVQDCPMYLSDDICYYLLVRHVIHFFLTGECNHICLAFSEYHCHMKPLSLLTQRCFSKWWNQEVLEDHFYNSAKIYCTPSRFKHPPLKHHLISPGVCMLIKIFLNMLLYTMLASCFHWWKCQYMPMLYSGWFHYNIMVTIINFMLQIQIR